jgi:large subunit ribosomal protein L13
VSITQRTTHFFTSDEVEKKWYLVDASGKTLGRIASKIASVLRGKHKPVYTPNADCGDFVVVVNAEKVKFTGKRLDQKEYFHYTGYPGGDRFEKAKDLLKTHPERILESAVRGMIPKTKLGKKIGMKLKVYAGNEHPHQAQKLQPLTF